MWGTRGCHVAPRPHSQDLDTHSLSFLECWLMKAHSSVALGELLAAEGSTKLYRLLSQAGGVCVSPVWNSLRDQRALYCSFTTVHLLPLPSSASLTSPQALFLRALPSNLLQHKSPSQSRLPKKPNWSYIYTTLWKTECNSVPGIIIRHLYLRYSDKESQSWKTYWFEPD